MLPTLCSHGHAIIASPYPPEDGGSCILMRELLAQFDPLSFTLVTRAPYRKSGPEEGRRGARYDLISTIGAIRGLNRWWHYLQLPLACARLARLTRRLDARVIVGVYPTLELLALAQRVAASEKLPLVAYFHDTLREGLDGTRWAKPAIRLQKSVFEEASGLLVMSQGMSELYRRKYGMEAEPIEHIYTEAIPNLPPAKVTIRQAFWAGSIYGININSVARVSRALEAIRTSFLLATSSPSVRLAALGVGGPHVRQTYFSKRTDYLTELQKQGLLVLALDWPDESSIHEDELATIFPTKTPEYLAAGRPILVHCPEHYFLAKFVQRHRCGLVVTERSPDALMQACARLLDSGEEARHFSIRALQAARLFSPGLIVPRFKAVVETAASLGWRPKHAGRKVS